MHEIFLYSDVNIPGIVNYGHSEHYAEQVIREMLKYPCVMEVLVISAARGLTVFNKRSKTI